MHEPLIIRGLALFLPVFILWLAWCAVKPDRRTAGAALLATVWQLPALLLVQEANAHFGWWTFQADGGLLHGMPADLWLGWAVLWGGVPVLALRRWPLWAKAALLAAADVLLMPLCAPVVVLHPTWWLGEAAAIFTSLLPGLLLAEWTSADRCLRARVVLQFFMFAGLMLWVIPSIAMEQTAGSWQTALNRPWPWQCLWLGLSVVVAVPALSAVQEFCERGHGTPLPLDPPRRLVMSGPYAFLANPMQTGMTLVFLVWGAWTGSVWVALISLAAVTTTAGIAGWNERTEMDERFGETWRDYRRGVRNWLPRFHPRPVPVPARLYIAETCIKCQSLRRWLERRAPAGLELVAAESHPSRALTRLTYEAPAWSESGIRAFARALEHLNLGWAWLGWIMRLPLLASVLQALADITGLGPQRLPDRK